MISSARGLWRTSEVASISSVVVIELPHSRATSRKGALLIAAMGARRAMPGTSTSRMRMVRGYQSDSERGGGVGSGPGRAHERDRQAQCALPQGELQFIRLPGHHVAA